MTRSLIVLIAGSLLTSTTVGAQSVALPGGGSLPLGGLSRINILGQTSLAHAPPPGLAPDGKPPENLANIFGPKAVARTAGYQFGLQALRQLVTTGSVNPQELGQYAVSPNGLLRDTTISSGASFIASLVPGGQVIKALVSGTAKTALRWGTGEKEDPLYLQAGTMGALAGSLLLKRIPGGTFIGGLFGQVGAETAYLHGRKAVTGQDLDWKPPGAPEL